VPSHTSKQNVKSWCKITSSASSSKHWPFPSIVGLYLTSSFCFLYGHTHTALLQLYKSTLSASSKHQPPTNTQQATQEKHNQKAYKEMAFSSSFLVLAALLALVPWQGIASDPSPLQDFCVADKKSPGIIYFVTYFQVITKYTCCVSWYYDCGNNDQTPILTS
jgi:hypothetical protein